MACMYIWNKTHNCFTHPGSLHGKFVISWSEILESLAEPGLGQILAQMPSRGTKCICKSNFQWFKCKWTCVLQLFQDFLQSVNTRQMWFDMLYAHKTYYKTTRLFIRNEQRGDDIMLSIPVHTNRTQHLRTLQLKWVIGKTNNSEFQTLSITLLLNQWYYIVQQRPIHVRPDLLDS